MTDIGHIYTDEEEKNKSKTYWDFSSGFPIPQASFHCAICNSNEPYIELNYYRYEESTNDYYAFIHVRCIDCGYIWQHEIRVSEADIENISSRNRKLYDWNEMKAIIDNEG